MIGDARMDTRCGVRIFVVRTEIESTENQQELGRTGVSGKTWPAQRLTR